jgi:hypothetical protein
MENEDPRKMNFKDAKFEFAPTTYVDVFSEVGEEFIKEIFGFEPGEYLISDESSIDDFLLGEDYEEEEVYQRIKELYGLGREEIGNGNFAEIFSKIHKEKYGNPS